MLTLLIIYESKKIDSLYCPRQFTAMIYFDVVDVVPEQAVSLQETTSQQ